MARNDSMTRLLHMRDYAQKAIAMVPKGKTREDLERDEKLRQALTRIVELAGEAANRVPIEIQRLHPEIPWAKALGMRNRLNRGGFECDESLWITLTVSMPSLLESLNRILNESETP